MADTQIDDGRIIMGSGPQAKAMVDGSEVEAISKDELYEILRAHRPIQLVNVLERENYKLGSIKKSVRIPLSELENRLMELDKSREVITYCANYDCEKSRRAAAILQSHGFAVRVYEGGIEEWKHAGLAVDLH